MTTTEAVPGKREFFEQEISRLMNRLYGTALRLTRHQSDAEDLVADTVAQAWDKFDKLQERDSFEGWLMRILSNRFISDRRRYRPDQLIEEPAAADDDDGEQPALFARLHQPFLLWWGTPEQQFINDLLREDLERALDELPDQYSIVIVMVEVLGYQYSEAAEQLGIPVGTVRSRLNRGRRMLQEALWNHAREAGLVADTTQTKREPQ
jgi:RNA polymerase sigma factor (sigma-70 family)